MTPTRIVAIVEGHGEVRSVPILLRRIAEEIVPNVVLDIPHPIRVHRRRIVKPYELERAVELAARQAGADGRVLILLDADRDCPATIGPELLARARACRADRAIGVVVANVEYESWFVAAAASIGGNRDLDPGLTAPDHPESLADPKGWLSRHMPSGRAYRETLDQPALTSMFNLDSARIAPSFQKLWRDLETLLAD